MKYTCSFMARESEMPRFAAILATLICHLCLCSCNGSTSITLFPLGMVSVCPGGQVLLTCERLNGSILFWDVSIPHIMASTNVATQNQGIIVPSQGDLLSPEFKINFTEFNVTRTSSSPLTSQLLINNVTTEINGSTIYCSEDGDETNAPMITINVMFKDEPSRNVDQSLNVSLMNYLLTNNVTVTLQWPREDGAVYHVSVSPEVPHTELMAMNHDIFATNLTISYNIQYNVSIASSLCGVTTTKVLNYVTCDHPLTQLLHDPIVMVMEFDIPKVEGQFITYTCPSGFVLTGPRVSVCTGNGEWEPDPGQSDCIAFCGLPLVNKNIKLNYSSTLEGSHLTLACENDNIIMSNINASTTILNVTCHSDRNWVPNPANFIESCSIITTAPPSDAETLLWALITIAVCAISSIVFLSIGYACGWFSHKHKQSRTSKAEDDSVEENNPHHNEGSQLPQTPGPLYYEEVELQQESTPEHQDQLVEVKENVAYGPIIVK